LEQLIIDIDIDTFLINDAHVLLQEGSTAICFLTYSITLLLLSIYHEASLIAKEFLAIGFFEKLEY